MMRHGSRTQTLRGMGLTGLATALVWFMALQVSLASAGERPKPVDFERDVRPILATNCAGCHSAERPKAGLDLRSVASMMRGGKSGPASSPSDPDGSLLLERIAQGEMPPGKARKLSADEVATVRAWIRGGARTDHPVAAARRPPRPSATRIGGSGRFGRSDGRRCRRDPDAAPDADARSIASCSGAAGAEGPDVLARMRIPAPWCDGPHLDLLGLPPSLEEVDAFLADDRPDAFERLVDRLLASPHLRRAVGPALAGRGRIRGYRRLRHRRHQHHSQRRQVALPRLCHPRVQRGQAVRPVPHRAARRRRALRLAAGQALHAGRSARP